MYGTCDRCGVSGVHTVSCAGMPDNMPLGQWVTLLGADLCEDCCENHFDDPEMQRRMRTIVVDADVEPVYSLPGPEPFIEVEQDEEKPWWKFW